MMSEECKKELRDEIEAQLDKFSTSRPKIETLESSIQVVSQVKTNPGDSKKSKKGLNLEKNKVANAFRELSYVADKFDVSVSFVMKVKEIVRTNDRARIYAKIEELLKSGHSSVEFADKKKYSPRIDRRL